MGKKAVLLLNLGSPASTETADVRDYLKEFLLDERVIDSPAPVRNFVVRGLILPRRPAQSAEAYAKVWTPEGSPLIVTSQQLQEGVQAASDIPVLLAMRYGEPSIATAVAEIKQKGIEELFIVPLYPHYAMSSYETVVVKVTDELAQQGVKLRYAMMQPFYRDDDYIEAMVENAQPWLDKPHDHVLFSFHGIPERHLRKSDPSHAHCLSRPDCCDIAHPCQATCYRHQCLETVKAFTAKAGLEEGRYGVSFQSRLGRDPWLKPYTDFVLKELPERGIKRLLVICPAFVSDCLETLEEIAMTGKKDFLEAGGEWFEQIPCMNTHPAWVRVLVSRIQAWQASSKA